MRISSEDLPRQLAKGLAPLYVVYGDGILLALEAADAIRAAALSAGYSEREVFIADAQFKWAELRHSAQSMSLFSSQKIIDLRLPTGKPGVEGGQALQDYCAALPSDTITLISLPALDYTVLKSKWFAALEASGVVVVANDIGLENLPAWIATRLKRQEQSADRDSLVFLAQKVEGNLLAAFQEIQKLALLFPEGHLSLSQINDSVMDVARYDVSKLAEAMLAGDVARYAHILEGLRAEGTATPQILWILADDLRAIAKVSRALQRSGNLASAIRDARIWSIRKDAIGLAARRISPAFAER
ncbi:MAG: polymerase subunit delta, partial [Pseudomonadota bacterium]